MAAVVVPAIKRHTATVIFAHGLGDSGAGWLFLVDNWRKRSKFEQVSFILPNAPQIPITLNMGMSMPGWYDIVRAHDYDPALIDPSNPAYQKSLDSIQAREDEPGIIKSQQTFHNLIDEEKKKGIPSERIVIGGFSQGGAMSLLSGVTYPGKLGGIVGLSCYLLLQSKLKDMIPAENPNKDTPIFMGHGDADPVVQYKWGQMTANKLKEWGWNVDFNTYPGLPHSAADKEIDDLEAYLNKQIPALAEEQSGGPAL